MINRANKAYTLGGGELFVRLPGEPFRYFGTTNEVKLSVKIDKIEHKNSEGASLVTDMEVVKEITATINFTTEDLSKDVIALAFGGESAKVEQSAGSSTLTIEAARGGGVYELGKVNITNVSVSYNDGSQDVALQEDKDFMVDRKFGTIEFVKDGFIAEGQNVTVNFDYEASTSYDFSLLNKTSREVALMFVSKPQVGPARKYLIHRVTLTMNGDYNLKSPEKLNSIAFEGKLLKDDTKPEGKQFFETLEVV